MMANAAFALGLAKGLEQRIDDLLPGIPFAIATHNFYRAAEHGMDARLSWPDRKAHCCTDRRPSWRWNSCRLPSRRSARDAGIGRGIEALSRHHAHPPRAPGERCLVAVRQLEGSNPASVGFARCACWRGATLTLPGQSSRSANGPISHETPIQFLVPAPASSAIFSAFSPAGGRPGSGSTARNGAPARARHAAQGNDPSGARALHRWLHSGRDLGSPPVPHCRGTDHIARGAVPASLHARAARPQSLLSRTLRRSPGHIARHFLEILEQRRRNACSTSTTPRQSVRRSVWPRTRTPRTNPSCRCSASTS